MRLLRAVAAGAAIDIITTVGGGYRISCGDYMVDAQLFETTVRALTYCRQALQLHFRLGNQVMGEAGTWDSLGLALYHLGRLSAASVCYERALGLYRKCAEHYHQACALSRLGDTLVCRFRMECRGYTFEYRFKLGGRRGEG